jgi:formylglycine-generating enzyme required for sulfatase activity
LIIKLIAKNGNPRIVHRLLFSFVDFFSNSISNFGIYDMAGNVREMTSTFWSGYPSQSRVSRGGNWGDVVGNVKSWRRWDYNPIGWTQHQRQGFRLVKTIP